MPETMQRDILALSGEIKRTVRTAGQTLTGLYDRLAKTYEPEIGSDGKMSDEAAQMFLAQHAETQGAIGEFRQAYQHIEAAERLIKGEGDE